MVKKTRKPRVRPPSQTAPPVRLRRDEVAASLRREITRQNALERSCEPLALIAETAIVWSEGGAAPGYTIVDAAGVPRSKTIRGKTVPFGIADLVAELRRDHRNLFGPAPARSGGPAPSPKAAPNRTDETDVPIVHLPAAPSLEIAERVVSPAAPEAVPASPEPPAIAPPLPETVAAVLADHVGGAGLTPPPSEPASSPSASLAGQSRPRDWIRLDVSAPPESPKPQTPPAASIPSGPSAAGAVAGPIRIEPAIVALLGADGQPDRPPPSGTVAAPPPREAARRYREPVAIRPEPIVPKPRLAGPWRPSRIVMRVLYVAAFVGGMAAYSAVRHLS